MIQWILAICSLVPLPFQNPTSTSGSSWFTYCWSLSWRILSITLANMWNEHSCTVVWTVFGFALLWDWNENWPFLVLWPLPSFPNLLIDQNSSRIFLLEIDNLIPSFMWKCKRTRLTKTILKIKDKIGGLISRHYKTEVIEEEWY